MSLQQTTKEIINLERSDALIYILIQNREFQSQIKYVFDTFFMILGIKYCYIERDNEFNIQHNDILIVYGNKLINFNTDSKIIFINQSNVLFGHSYLKDFSVPNKILKYRLHSPIKNNNDIISIYRNNLDPYINQTKSIIVTNLDIVSDSFFMLSRYEEVVNKKECKTEKFNRFSAESSLAYKEGFLERPVVNEYIELLWTWIYFLNPKIKRKNLWVYHDFAVCLTHDVDDIQKNSLYKFIKKTKNKHSLYSAFKTINLFDIIKSEINISSDPYWNFEEIMSIEERFGFTSSFYFMNGGISDKDNRYSIKNRHVKSLIKDIRDRGNEVGYHGSFCSFNKPYMIKCEKDGLDKIIGDKSIGTRQHFLRFQVPYTWRYQKMAGLLYDTTLGYADKIGFRSGICMPYYPYDILNDKVIKIWEIPLIAMDGTFVSYLKVKKSQEVVDILYKQISTLKKYNGVGSILLHNSITHTVNKLKWKKTYNMIMNIISKENGIGLSGQKIINIIEGY